MRLTMLMLLALTIAATAFGQTSANFKLEEYTFNNGGNPAPELWSASFRLTVDSIGDGFAAWGLAGGSFTMDGGFLPAFPPPGEVISLRFTDADTMGWTPEPSVGAYNLYRGDLGNFTGYGTCLHGGIAGTAWDDAEVPAAGSGYFYLVTASNRLAEEGTKGWTSEAVERGNPSPCLP